MKATENTVGSGKMAESEWWGNDGGCSKAVTLLAVVKQRDPERESTSMLARGIGEWNNAGLRQQQCNRPRKMVDNNGAMGKGESKYWETHGVPTCEAA